MLAVRSSSSQEDLAGQAGAGLYDSVLNVDVRDAQAIQKALTDVWLSLFTKRAVLSRRQSVGTAAHTVVPLMAVLVQEQISPSYSFVLHTKDPFSASDLMYAELAVGLGETLASAS